MGIFRSSSEAGWAKIGQEILDSVGRQVRIQPAPVRSDRKTASEDLKWSQTHHEFPFYYRP